MTPQTGRHPLPPPDAFAATLSRWGVTPDTQVVVYDAVSGMFAARLWWMLHWAGHERAAVLDGGLQAWLLAGGQLDRTVQQREAVVFQPAWRHWMAVGTGEVEASLRDGSLLVVDARAAERYEGRVEPFDPVAGHIPGAVNHPCAWNLGPDGRFLPPAALQQRWLETLDGREPATVACQCGSGITACHDLLALEHAGLPGARLYPGSWSEWIRDPARPVVRGTR